MIEVQLTNDRIGRIIDFCQSLELIIDVSDNVKIIPIHVPYLQLDEDGVEVLASFCATSNRPHQLSTVPYILICTDLDDFHEIKKSIVHEIVHYEQWRDGKKITERGVAVRVRNIMSQLL